MGSRLDGYNGNYSVELEAGSTVLATATGSSDATAGSCPAQTEQQQLAQTAQPQAAQPTQNKELVWVPNPESQGEFSAMQKRSLVGLAAILAALTVGAMPLAGQRDCCQGDWWLRWTRAQRETYVLGYTTGYYHGFRNGCSTGTKNWPVEVTSLDSQPYDKCIKGQKTFGAQTDQLVDSITEFYKRYSDVRDIVPYEVLDLLGEGLSIEQIHRYPSMRHKQPAE